MDDKTPIQGHDIYQPSQELDGFELYENATRFLASLGIPAEEVANYPQILVTTVGSLLKQVDDSIAEVDTTSNEMRQAMRHLHRMRAQRDALRSAFLRLGRDPNQILAGATEDEPSTDVIPDGMQQR